MERWKEIPGYEGYYDASDQGRIRSVDRVVPHARHGTIKRKGKVLTSFPDPQSGHFRLTLSVEGKVRNEKVHRLVALTWIGPCPDGFECCHEDGDPANNSESNLRWDTKSSNARDRIKHGTHRVVNKRRVVRSDGAEYVSISEAAASVGRDVSSVWKVCAGRQKTCAGYGWKYADIES